MVTMTQYQKTYDGPTIDHVCTKRDGDDLARRITELDQDSITGSDRNVRKESIFIVRRQLSLVSLRWSIRYIWLNDGAVCAGVELGAIRQAEMTTGRRKSREIDPQWICIKRLLDPSSGLQRSYTDRRNYVLN
jgi:hypothetical protein